jgi:hypothetical protein
VTPSSARAIESGREGSPLTTREEHGRAIAVLIRVFGDIDVAEEAVQDAFTAAVQRWPSAGLPPSPAPATQPSGAHPSLRWLFHPSPTCATATLPGEQNPDGSPSVRRDGLSSADEEQHIWLR